MKKKNILVYAIAALFGLSVFSTSIAFFAPNITHEDASSTIAVTGGEMSISFVKSTGNISLTNILPGESTSKDFSVVVTNSTDSTLDYDINIDVVSNTFTTDTAYLVYTLYTNNSTYSSPTVITGQRKCINEEFYIWYI